jgi:hypothetical protein
VHRDLWVHMACWHLTWPLLKRFEIAVLLTILINNSHVAWQTKDIEGRGLKHSWNLERLIEHIRQNVGWVLSCEVWLERIVKWIWNVSNEFWSEAAQRFENIIGNFRKIHMLVDILVTYTKYRKLCGKNYFFYIIKLIFFGNSPVCSQQNCLTLKSIPITFHADRYIITKYCCSLLPSSSQFRQFNTWSSKQFAPQHVRH